MNRTIKLLMISDIFVLTGFGLSDPILAIFIKDNIAGGTIVAAGLASAIFFAVKSLVQLPFSRHVDVHHDRNDLWWLSFGTLLLVVVPFIFIFATSMVWIFVAQIVHGIAAGFAYPSWLGIWSTHLDRKRESFEWSLYSTLVGLGTAISASIGATIAQIVGFQYTFLFVGVMSLLGCGTLFFLRRNLRGNILR